MAQSCANAGSKIAADRHYDQRPFIDGVRDLGMGPHPRTKSKGSQLDTNTSASEDYLESMKSRYKVEGVFGCGKSVGGMRQTKLRGTDSVEVDFTLQVIAKNLLTTAKRAPCWG